MVGGWLDPWLDGRNAGGCACLRNAGVGKAGLFVGCEEAVGMLT